MKLKGNLELIEHFTDEKFIKPKVYPSKNDFAKTKLPDLYITISPGSVWSTKQFPANKWIAFMNGVEGSTFIFLLGGKK